MRLKGPEGEVTAADAFGGCDLLICTGNSISLLDQEKVTRPKNDFLVTSALSVTQRLAFVFMTKKGSSAATDNEAGNGAEGIDGTAVAYSIPQFEPVSSLALHDVYGGVGIGRRLVVFCSGAIRVLRLQLNGVPAASMEKRIDVKGVLTGCVNRAHKSATLLIATKDEYKLVVLTKGTVVPLFPIMNDLNPLLAPFQSDFLVVQGTFRDDVATGLCITETGEFSKSGVVIQWPKYPTCLKTSGNYIFAVVDNTLYTHFVDPDSKEIKENPDGLRLDRKVKNIFKLSLPLKIKSVVLQDKLGSDYMEEADILFVLHNGDLMAWSPPPLLLDLEVHIRKGENVDVSAGLDSTAIDGVGKEYLVLCKMLYLLKQNKVDAAIKHMRMLESLDPKMVLYMYNMHAADPNSLEENPNPDMQYKTYPGLEDLVQECYQKSQSNELNQQFLKVYLHKELKHLHKQDHKVKPDENLTRLLELHYARLLNDNELARFIITTNPHAKSEILDWLESCKKYEVLEQVLSITGESDRLFKLWQTTIRDSQSKDEEVRQAANSMASYFTSNQNIKSSDSLLPTILDLVCNELLSTNVGMQVLQSGAVKDVDPVDLLEMLKQHSDSGPIWRAFLKHLVYTKNILTDDLASIIVTDLIETVNEYQQEVTDVYDTFANLMWPKPAFISWLPNYVKSSNAKKYPEKLIKLQQEFWTLLDKGLDVQQQLSTFDSQLDCMKAERALIYQKLGLHEQSLMILCSYTDFRAVINYAGSFTSSLPDNETTIETKQDLVYLALKAMLNSNCDSPLITEFLASNQINVSLEHLLDVLNGDMLFSTIADFAIKELQTVLETQSQAQLQHAASKSYMNTVSQASNEVEKTED